MIETNPKQYLQFQIDEKGVKVRYSDPQCQMQRKDQEVAKLEISSVREAHALKL